MSFVLLSGCFSGWKSDGPWACEGGAKCPDGFTCDDGVCCKPGGTPACPTLPVDGACPGGGPTTTYYNDADGDGVGWDDSGRPFCRGPQQGGWVTKAGDCNDADDTVSPDVGERCNGLDDDCDGVIDNGLPGIRWYRDADGDTYGSDCATCVLQACAQPAGYVDRAGDCDDSTPDVRPGAPEYCNQRDDNCNQLPDDGPFADTVNPGEAYDPAKACTVANTSGACVAGSFQCLFTGVAFERRCVSDLPRTTDVCRDGVDNDCDGASDNEPGCGGPADMLTSEGVTMGAFVLRDALAAPPAGCSRDGGTEAMSWLRPLWNGTGEGLHVLYANAAPGQWWDLREAGTLNLDFSYSWVGNDDGGTGWNIGSSVRSVSVVLCGPNGWQRFTPAGAALLSRGTGTRALRVPLQTSDPQWPSPSGSVDLSRVDRVELYLGATGDVTFTTRFALNDGGGTFSFAP